MPAFERLTLEFQGCVHPTDTKCQPEPAIANKIVGSAAVACRPLQLQYFYVAVGSNARSSARSNVQSSALPRDHTRLTTGLRERTSRKVMARAICCALLPINILFGRLRDLGCVSTPGANYNTRDQEQSNTFCSCVLMESSEVPMCRWPGAFIPQ